MSRPFRSCFRSGLAAASALVLPLAPVQGAEPARFDLPGPELSILVTRGDRQLPIAQVPSLASGDKLEITANLPNDQSIHYRLISAFLRGAINPPPKQWIATAQTWKQKDKDRLLKLTVPADARQIVLFMVPETGGDFGTISDAVRGKPGEFVRVTQEINQLSLDHARLNAFVGAIESQESRHPEQLQTLAPVLASSLSMKLKDDCLAKVVQSQAACLLENSASLVLGDIHTNSLTETLTGTPADLALQISATPQAGSGFYSAYINVVLDLTRLFGAFKNPNFTYLPALGIQKDSTLALQLNSAPSFRKPKSVLVAALPAVEKDVPPPLRKSDQGIVCAASPASVFKVEGAPLVYATQYAHDMAIRLTNKQGTAVEIPVVARADRGGYVPRSPINLGDFTASNMAQLHGSWGFEPFQGPAFIVQTPQDDGWQIDERAQPAIVGRDNEVLVKGLAPGCIEGVTMTTPGGQTQPIKWALVDAQHVSLQAPLTGLRHGEVEFTIQSYGRDHPARLSLRTYAEKSRIDSLSLHSGDATAVLTGLRLDQVSTVTLDGIEFLPGALTREDKVDKLEVRARQSDKAKALTAGAISKAKIVLNDGRDASLAVTIASARPRTTIVGKSISIAAKPPGPQIRLISGDLLPDTARLTASFRIADGGTLTPEDVIAIETQNGSAQTTISSKNGLQLESGQIAIATLDAATFGVSASGPVNYRLIQSGVAGDWQTLATLVRMPSVDAVTCEPTGQTCRLKGKNLFLIKAIAADPQFSRNVTVPEGFTSDSIETPRPQNGKLYLRLRDAPSDVQELVL